MNFKFSFLLRKKEKRFSIERKRERESRYSQLLLKKLFWLDEQLVVGLAAVNSSLFSADRAPFANSQMKSQVKILINAVSLPTKEAAG